MSYDDLPAGTKERFKKRVVPLSLDVTGASSPWETPEDKKIISIWNVAFDGTDHVLEEGNFECDLFYVAKTLVSAYIFCL